ncbi:hypothetical protein ACFY0B_34840 [Streptomyces sp. NPDC001797]|uniref:hypothetical protein n=1 Tax=Streptomyces sp. NPDC001797 TaxID=3364610 RepID=UPI0036A28E48
MIDVNDIGVFLGPAGTKAFDKRLPNSEPKSSDVRAYDATGISPFCCDTTRSFTVPPLDIQLDIQLDSHKNDRMVSRSP